MLGTVALFKSPEPKLVMLRTLLCGTYSPGQWQENRHYMCFENRCDRQHMNRESAPEPHPCKVIITLQQLVSGLVQVKDGKSCCYWRKSCTVFSNDTIWFTEDLPAQTTLDFQEVVVSQSQTRCKLTILSMVLQRQPINEMGL